MYSCCDLAEKVQNNKVGWERSDHQQVLHALSTRSVPVDLTENPYGKKLFFVRLVGCIDGSLRALTYGETYTR